MIELMVFEPNVNLKSFFIWPRPFDFSIQKIRIPETGFPDSGFSDPELKIQILFLITNLVYKGHFSKIFTHLINKWGVPKLLDLINYNRSNL